MKLKHSLSLEIDNGTGLAALAIIALMLVTLVLGVAGISAWLGDKPGRSAGAIDVSAHYGSGHAQTLKGDKPSASLCEH